MQHEGPRVAAGDLVFFDCGASVQGYGSDTGRTLTLAPPSDEARRIMDALKPGMEAAFALVRPGARMCDIFHAGQNAVRNSGIPWYTRGHIGHAMGLGMGEMAPAETRVLEPGMEGRRSFTQNEHKEILAAVLRRDAAATTDLLSRHIERRLDKITASIREGLARIYVDRQSAGPG